MVFYIEGKDCGGAGQQAKRRKCPKTHNRREIVLKREHQWAKIALTAA
jgi:hypothetical protein